MKKSISVKILVAVLTIALLMTGCACEHEWTEANCLAAKTCNLCGEVEGEALGHSWNEASCEAPKTCSFCGATEGEALAHTWNEATCAAPKTCSVCKATEGETLAHTWKEANYQEPAICTVCNAIDGEPLTPDFVKYGMECKAELDTAYPYISPCFGDPQYHTAGTVTISDYAAFVSDETHEAKDGYVWQTITITFLFDDKNAQRYGATYTATALDYYDVGTAGAAHESDTSETFTVNYCGEDHECQVELYQEGGWEMSENPQLILATRYYFCVPAGFDGIVAGAYDKLNDYTDRENQGIYDIYNENCVFYRLPPAVVE